MAKRSSIEKNNQRIATVERYSAKRMALKEKLRLSKGEARMRLQRELDAFPRDSAPGRVRNRCALTGRPRGFYRKFGMSRNMLRHYVMFGQVPGVAKASW